MKKVKFEERDGVEGVSLCSFVPAGCRVRPLL